MLSRVSRLIVFGLLLTVLSCTANRLGVVRSISAEKELGRETTPKFLLAKGGVYNDAETQEYVQSLVAKLSLNTSIPDEFNPIPIRVLDTNMPSAYALPGGSIYVSRGIIALSNTEAQLAGVIAHEIGHVIARHSVKSVAANERIVLDIVEAENERLLQADSKEKRASIIEAALASRISEVTSFSREQELEADRIAIEILGASGYGSTGFGNLLRRLDRWETRRARKIGVSPEELEDLAERSGYPEIGERLAALGRLKDVPATPGTRDRLMAVIDGLRFEDRFNGGFIRASKYWNKQRQISFDVPSKFTPLHGEHLRLAFAKGRVLFRIDRAKPGRFEKLGQRLNLGEIPLEDVETSTINDIPVVIGKIRSKKETADFVARVVFFDLDSHLASLTVFSKKEDEEATRPLYDMMVASFRRVRIGEIPELRTYETRRIAAGEDVPQIARGTGFDGDREAELRLLNGLGLDDPLMTGDWIKLVK